MAEPVLTYHLYLALRDILPVAVDGVEARQRDADGLADRLAVVEGQSAIERIKFYVEEFRERAEGGDLA